MNDEMPAKTAPRRRRRRYYLPPPQTFVVLALLLAVLAGVIMGDIWMAGQL
jgi:hypothetical protein